jgi:hypothetical protein
MEIRRQALIHLLDIDALNDVADHSES